MSDHNNTREVRVARIGKPHGIRGEVTVEVFTDSPDKRFTVGSVLSVRMPPEANLSLEQLTVEKSRWNKKILLLKFEEFSDRNTAELLRNTELYVPREHLRDESEGWYADDLVGLAVHKGSVRSSQIGEVTDLIMGAAQDLLVVRLIDGREVLIPLVEEIVPEINEEVGAVVITPPPGLLELNQD